MFEIQSQLDIPETNEYETKSRPENERIVIFCLKKYLLVQMNIHQMWVVSLTKNLWGWIVKMQIYETLFSTAGVSIYGPRAAIGPPDGLIRSSCEETKI